MKIGFSTVGYLLNRVEFVNLDFESLDEVEFVLDLGTKTLPKKLTSYSLHAPYFYTNLASLSEAHLKFSVEEVSRVLEYGVKTVVHEGSVTTKFDNYIVESIKVLEHAFDVLTAKYKNIVVENVTGSLFPTFSQFVDFFLNYDVEFCFDISHYFLRYGVFNLPIILNDKFVERISKVHISDTVEGKDNHLPIGEGNIDFKLIKAFIRDLKSDVSIIVESIPRNVKDGKAIRDFYANEISKLKEILYE